MKVKTERQAKLRAIRDIFGCTVDDVARESGASTKTVYRYETGTYRIHTNEIEKVANWYNKKKVELILSEKDLWELVWTEKAD